MTSNISNNRIKSDRRKLPIKWAKVRIDENGNQHIITVDGGNLVFARNQICLQVEVWKSDLGLPGKGKKRVTVSPEMYGLGSARGVCDKDIVECKIRGKECKAEVVFVLDNVLQNTNAWFVKTANEMTFPLKEATDMWVIGTKLTGERLKEAHDMTNASTPDFEEQVTMEIEAPAREYTGPSLTYYTDGAAIENPGPCGGAFCVYENDELIHEKAIPIGIGTNNIGELIAIRETLKDVNERKPGMAVIYSDSQYAVKGITEWSMSWIENGWKTSGGGDVKNADLFKEILTLIKKANQNTLIEFKWVKGHDGNEGNERADRLSYMAAESSVEV